MCTQETSFSTFAAPPACAFLPNVFFHQKINRYILRKLLRHQPSDYRHTASHKEGLNEIIDSLRAILRVCDEFSAHLEQAIQALRIRLAVSQHKAGGLTRIIHIHNAAMALLEMLNTVNADVRGDNLIVEVSLAVAYWSTQFNPYHQSFCSDVSRYW